MARIILSFPVDEIAAFSAGRRRALLTTVASDIVWEEGDAVELWAEEDLEKVADGSRRIPESGARGIVLSVCGALRIRLQDVEGIRANDDDTECRDAEAFGRLWGRSFDAFKQFWDARNATVEGGSWEDNPDVVAFLVRPHAKPWPDRMLTFDDGDCRTEAVEVPNG